MKEQPCIVIAGDPQQVRYCPLHSICTQVKHGLMDQYCKNHARYDSRYLLIETMHMHACL